MHFRKEKVQNFVNAFSQLKKIIQT